MKKSVILGSITLAGLFSFGCQSAGESKNSNLQNLVPAPSMTATPKPESKVKIDVPQMAGKPAEELDKILGKPEKITPATVQKEMPGEYRLYKIESNPKGLSVRFYRGKAVRFNLILGKPFAAAKDALLETFNIDVRNVPPANDKAEPLSQKWQGEFGGVRFATVYAKKDKPDGQFVMVHAEIAR
jgi:hypothetical protein